MTGPVSTNCGILPSWMGEQGKHQPKIFANFRVSMGKKNVGGMCALKFDATDLPHLNRHTPSFSGQAWSWPCVNHLPSRAFQSQLTQIRVHQKKAILRRFICTKSFFQAERSIFTYSMSLIFWKLLSSFGTSGDLLGASCDPSDVSKHCGLLKPCHIIIQAWMLENMSLGQIKIGERQATALWYVSFINSE